MTRRFVPQIQFWFYFDATLHAYVNTYIKEEIKEEGILRKVPPFLRFLQVAGIMNGQMVHGSNIATAAGVPRSSVDNYFSILEDLLIAVRLPVFTKRTRRRMIAHPKFYYFDAGVFQAIRPRGPLDAPEQIHGAALETLFLQQVRALNDYAALGYRVHYWRTSSGDEVDFVLYGERGLRAFEVKMAHTIRQDDLRALRGFQIDFPQAKPHLLYLGDRRWHDRGVEVLPFIDCVTRLDQWI